ncbi:UNVERIFIED_CONTAM: FAD-dependent oxidoreductase [Mycobacterium avium subsp. hominissuis]
MTDAIVIGAGHNGLTAAAYLARAGCSVTVLESQPFIGGMTATTPTLDEVPGYLFDHCAVDMIGLFNTSRSVVDELRLADYGLRFIDIDPYATYLGPDGMSLSLSTNLDRTVADIARYSRRDAERYRELATAVNDLLYTITPYLQGHPKRVRPGQLIRIATAVPQQLPTEHTRRPPTSPAGLRCGCE